MALRILTFSIVLGAKYQLYVKPIATYAPQFSGYNNAVSALVFKNFISKIAIDLSYSK